ncbi:MAG: small subunit ribosomal protein [Solirubrobacteraceae bacterium]|jgi:small subunit ribosomal protein S9|nr:small subunit ribosomal protein [Solirubrobacteraceae bacterium]
MADDRTPADEETPQEPTAGEEQAPVEEPAAERPAGEEEPAPVEEPVAEQAAGEEEPAGEAAPAPVDEAAPAPADETAPAPVDEAAPAPADETAPASADEAVPAPADEPAPAPAAEAAPAPTAAADDEGDEDEEEPTPRVKPEIPGADLEVDIVTEGSDPLSRGQSYSEDDDGEPVETEDGEEVPDDQPIAAVTIDLAADARYRATGKRKTAVARVTLRPGSGAYVINGRTLEEFFPRPTLQRNIRQPLEAVGYESRMDVVARMHGGGVSAQAGALRHGISRALLEADPNLRGELKRRGFLTRDPRVKERKKAGLKKARKRPQFSKR